MKARERERDTNAKCQRTGKIFQQNSDRSKTESPLPWEAIHVKFRRTADDFWKLESPGPNQKQNPRHPGREQIKEIYLIKRPRVRGGGKKMQQEQMLSLLLLLLGGSSRAN
ncbi:hypothetical protein RUM44_004621 [Polyplax serrata]|uniref:Uncharacterized protein n=1 Tax=Polyplax serrata TaxID=468196 RepID=A0ABR1B3C4_POLSC